VPVGRVTLRTWWYMSTAETAGAFDQMTVALLRPDGTWLTDLATVDNTAPVGVWQEIMIDLSSYAGQTVVLQFTGRTDDANITDFYLDDVSIVACVADPQPTATATQAPPTLTPTLTATKALSTMTPTVTATQSPPTATRTTTVPSVTATAALTATRVPPTTTPSATATQAPPIVTPTLTVTPEQGSWRTHLPFIIR
jgi:hypothetical protein